MVGAYSGEINFSGAVASGGTTASEFKTPPFQNLFIPNESSLHPRLDFENDFQRRVQKHTRSKLRDTKRIKRNYLSSLWNRLDLDRFEFCLLRSGSLHWRLGDGSTILFPPLVVNTPLFLLLCPFFELLPLLFSQSETELLLLVVSDFEQKLQNHNGFGLILMDLGLFGLFKFLKKKCMKVHDEHSWMFIFFFDFSGFLIWKGGKRKIESVFDLIGQLPTLWRVNSDFSPLSLQWLMAYIGTN